MRVQFHFEERHTAHIGVYILKRNQYRADGVDVAPEMERS